MSGVHHRDQVVYPHCATCFGRCYPGGSSLITDGNSVFEGLNRLLTTSSSRQLPKRVQNAETKENGDSPTVENGVVADVKESENSNIVEDKDENQSLNPES
ncbi:hypothetical protein E3N88_18706 [Mikania micrantha]|uniref:Uncharacterized protein n=1 Tax=Mikania micrantha TaxID=192012 RepID=A0A5N6NMW1_9ASTR|nr:hypothetical protein E3N88_18706 [Mikania micrantha]